MSSHYEAASAWTKLYRRNPKAKKYVETALRYTLEMCQILIQLHHSCGCAPCHYAALGAPKGSADMKLQKEALWPASHPDKIYRHRTLNIRQNRFCANPIPRSK